MNLHHPHTSIRHMGVPHRRGDEPPYVILLAWANPSSPLSGDDPAVYGDAGFRYESSPFNGDEPIWKWVDGINIKSSPISGDGPGIYSTGMFTFKFPVCTGMNLRYTGLNTVSSRVPHSVGMNHIRSYRI